MRRFTAFGAVFVAVLATSALAAGTAAAKTPNFDMTWNFHEHQLATGETVHLAIANGPGEDGTATIYTHPGAVTCEPGFAHSGWEAEDETNDEPTDKLELLSATGILDGEEACSNSSGLGEDAHVYSYPQRARLSLSGSKGKAEVKAKSKDEPIVLKIEYSDGDLCVYTSTKLKGTLALSRHFEVEGYAGVDFTEQKVKLSKTNSSPECSKHVTVNLQFGFLTVDGDYVFGHLE